MLTQKLVDQIIEDLAEARSLRSKAGILEAQANELADKYIFSAVVMHSNGKMIMIVEEGKAAEIRCISRPD